MNWLVPITSQVPVLVRAAGGRARTRFWEFFAANIRNKHTRRAYAQATREFLAWCDRWCRLDCRREAVARRSLCRATRPRALRADRQAAPRRSPNLFDWLVTGQVMPVNPASSVRGPSHSVKRGKTPVLDPSEARQLLDAIDVSTGIVRLNSILPAGAPARDGAPLFLLRNRRHAHRDSTPKMTYTHLP